jgi:3-methyl-2-oxobutanoate hydroxymethyltransferase
MGATIEKKITVLDIAKMKKDGKRFPVLTAYGYQMAMLLDRAGIPLILVGDSVGMVEAGYDSTLPVTVDEMIYHTRAVTKGAKRALVVADMPFMSYQVSTEEAKRNAGRLVKEGGAEAVKLEGGIRSAEVVRAIVEMDIPVMGHVGLTPQSVNALGGYRVQGKGIDDAERVMADALAIEEAGAFSVVLECVPAALSAEITAALKIPTIGIGAGPETDAQVLVINDMLGLGPKESMPKFVRLYADLETTILTAVERFSRDVVQGKFPTKEESY